MVLIEFVREDTVAVRVDVAEHPAIDVVVFAGLPNFHWQERGVGAVQEQSGDRIEVDQPASAVRAF
ncbi:hypothetical protein D3C85_1429800 [compost metagenome]